MTKMMLSICVRYDNDAPAETRWKVIRHAYVGENESVERVKDNRYVWGIVQRLTDGSAGSTWVEGRPGSDEREMFDVIIKVSDHGKSDAEYTIDYQRHDGCPAELVDDGMAIYRTIKKFGIRPTKVALQAKRHKKLIERKQKEQDAEMNVVDETACCEAAPANTEDKVAKDDVVESVNQHNQTFEVGAVYQAECVDALGYVVKMYVKVVGLMPESRRIVFVRENSGKPVTASMTVGKDGVWMFSHRSLGCPVRATARI